MVNLTRIYTKTGDSGSTALGDMSHVPKTDRRLIAYADVDETNTVIGVAIALGSLLDPIAAVLLRVQNDLFDLGADLSTPVAPDEEPGSRLRLDNGYVEYLEQQCDRFNADLPNLRSFILSGGTPGAALLHQARTVARRAERSAWQAVTEYPDTTNAIAPRYLNRLSDLLFILARQANLERGDALWQPGGQR